MYNAHTYTCSVHVDLPINTLQPTDHPFGNIVVSTAIHICQN